MSENTTNANRTSRRRFLTDSGRIAGVSTLAGMSIPYVHAAGNDTIQLALVGCGGRGTGAAENALGVKNGAIKLVAMADVFPSKLADSHGKLRQKFPTLVDVPRTASLSASTVTVMRSILSSPATSPSSRPRPRSAGYISATPSTRA
jgi:hypothetical protein